MGYDETENKLVPLIEVQNPLELEMLQDLLQQEDIFTVALENGSIGNYMKITMGYSFLGETLYVQQSDYFRARELLQVLQQNGKEAIDDAQSQAFGDADDFEQYEEIQSAVNSHGEQDKMLELAVLLLVAVILITLKVLHVFT